MGAEEVADVDGGAEATGKAAEASVEDAVAAEAEGRVTAAAALGAGGTWAAAEATGGWQLQRNR